MADSERRSRRRRTTTRWLAAGALVLATAGCGGQGTPAEAEPELAVQLDRIDAAVAARDHEAARAGVEALVEVAKRAEDDGDLTAGQADRIVSAAEGLLAELPAPEDAPAEPEPEPAPVPPPTEEPEADEEEHEDEDKEEDKPDKPDKPEKHDKDDEKHEDEGNDD